MAASAPDAYNPLATFPMHSEKAVSDRFLIALLIAGLIHAALILGVNFEMPKPEKIRKSLDITLIQSASRVAPKKADFLAQENQVGSDEGEKKALPRTAPPPREGVGRQVERAAVAPTPVREARRKPVLVQEKSPKKVVADDGEEDRPQPELPKLSAETLSQQITEVSATLSQSHETDTHHPRIVHINSVNAHKYKAAAYEHAWQQKIERIGNLNYPDEARRQKLSGSLVMSVGINPDGSIQNIKISHSSGHQVLDDAAERIVRLASPFSPFPAELRQEADVLVIIRTWRFYSDYRLETR
ncbi:energy transducer TonB [Methylomagnum sp.]